MSVQIIQERLEGYSCKSTLEEEQALREITQEVILAGLNWKWIQIHRMELNMRCP